MNYPEHVRQKNWIGFEKNCEKFCEFCLVHIADNILLIFFEICVKNAFETFSESSQLFTKWFEKIFQNNWESITIERKWER